MIQNHLVSLPAKPGLFVTTESSMSRIQMVTIGPDPAGLQFAANSVSSGGIASPDARSEPVNRVIPDRDRLF